MAYSKEHTFIVSRHYTFYTDLPAFGESYNEDEIE